LQWLFEAKKLLGTSILNYTLAMAIKKEGFYNIAEIDKFE
jgi:hypothetical protein